MVVHRASSQAFSFEVVAPAVIHRRSYKEFSFEVIILGTELTLRVPSWVTPGETFSIDGWLKDELGNGIDGMAIDIYRDGALQTSVTTYHSDVHGHGYYVWSTSIAVEGEYTFQTKFAGTPEYHSSESPLKSVTISPTPPETVWYSITVKSADLKGVEFAGVPVTLDGASGKTPCTFRVEQAKGITVDYRVTVQTPFNKVKFVKWEDGSTNPERIISVSSDVELTAFYETAPPPPEIPWGLIAVLSGLGIFIYVLLKIK